MTNLVCRIAVQYSYCSYCSYCSYG